MMGPGIGACLGLADAERAFKQAVILWSLWFSRNYVSEGQAAFEEILALPSVVASPVIRQRALPLLGHLAGRHADYVVAIDAWQELLAAQEAAGDRHGAANTLVELANMHYLQGAYPSAWSCLDASRAHLANIYDRRLQAVQRLYGARLPCAKVVMN